MLRATSVSLSNKQSRIVEIAASVAKLSLHESRHGAVLISGGGEVIKTACNRGDFTAFGERFNNVKIFATRHAEINVCLNVPYAHTKGGTVYVVRLGKGGEFRYSRPCGMCMLVMKFCGIKKVFFSNKDGGISLIKI